MAATVDHPEFPQLNEPNLPLWRYMDYPAFHWLVETRQLFMPRVAALFEKDPFEGSFPQRTYQAIARQISQLQQQAKQIFSLNVMSHIAETACRNHYVSCWHANQNESAAMWAHYGVSRAAVAIRTSYDELRNIFSDQFHMGMVRYIDYEMEALNGGNTFALIMHKRRSFEHEREVRVAVYADAEKPTDHTGELVKRISSEGYSHPLRDFGFINAVYVHPTAPNFILELAKMLAKEKNLPEPHRSSLAATPLR